MRFNRGLTELIRMERFEDIYESFQSDTLSCSEAAMILGCSERHFLRLRGRYEEEGLEGLRDRRVGRVSTRRAADEEVRRVTQLYEQRYSGFSIRHFHEFAVREHGLRRGYTWTRDALLQAGLVEKSRRGGPHRLRRPRKPMAGMMLHQDGSTHRWFGEGYSDLIVTMDDATSEITSAFFCEEEGTMSSFRGLQETMDKNGLFCSFYTDRGSHYWFTPTAGGKVDKHNLTQVGRACKQLGVEHIAAYSPEARGRSERMFGTLQGRLVQELALKGITSMDAANRYLREVYLPRHNQQFSVVPESDQSAYLPTVGFHVTDILCIHEERTVTNDNQVHYQGLKLQIPPSSHRHHYVKVKVRVHHYPDNSLAIFHGPRCIGAYDANGQQKQEKTQRAA